MKQAHIEKGFKGGDLPADGRRRHCQNIGRSGEAADPRRHLEYMQRIERRNRPGQNLPLDENSTGLTHYEFACPSQMGEGLS